MGSRKDEFRKSANELWKQAIGQLDEVKDVLIKSRDRLETDMQRLHREQDKLLKKLGEETYRWAREAEEQVPAMVRRTMDKLTEVVDTLAKTERRRPKKTDHGGKSAQSKAKKATSAKKTKAKKAKKSASKKKTSKKKTAKKPAARKAKTKSKPARRPRTKKKVSGKPNKKK